jgi:hypothetical protein
MSALDLPPGIGLVGTPLGTFRAPPGARRSASLSLFAIVVLGAITWAMVARHPYRYASSTQIVLPVAFAAFAGLGFLVRSARVAVTRDGVRWGWTAFGFHQPASRITLAPASPSRRAAARGGSSRRATGTGSTCWCATCAAPSCRCATTPAERRCAPGCRATAAFSTCC